MEFHLHRKEAFSMLRIAICDDVSESLIAIKDLVLKWDTASDNTVIELFSNGDSLIEEHEKRPYDIILLDIVMPLVNGIDAAAEIRKSDKNVKIVFLTASPEFAIESYSVHANGYLLKPIREEKLHACLSEMYTDIASHTKYILIRDALSVHRVAIDEIEYVEAQGKHVMFSLSDSSNLSSNEPFYHYETKLSSEDGFFKCHRSYIVNVFHISKYTPKEITMRSGCRIPISRSSHKEFESAYFELVFGKVGDIQ